MPIHRSLLLPLLLLLPRVVAGATLEVPVPHATLGGALGVAAAGDTIVVAPGVYAPSTNGESYPLSIALDGLVLLGAGIGETVLDAEDTGNLLVLAGNGGKVEGFTLTRGSADRGGAIDIQAGAWEIAHNLLLANGALLRGSALNVQGNSAPWIHHNVAWENYDLDLDHFGDPHGMQFGSMSSGVVEHNLIGRTDSNGLFYLEDSFPTIRHNIFFENGIDGVRGRGICAFGTDNAVIAHNLFWGNSIAALIVQGVGNVSAAEANELMPDDGIYGNLDDDPRLRDPDGGDFRLMSTSPAIDAGLVALGSDPDGTVLDLGPYFFDQSAVAAPPAALRLVLLPNRPNPFNPRTTLRYRLETPGRVRVALYDARGRLVRELVDAEEPEGLREHDWDGRDAQGRAVASGVYRVVVTTQGERRSLPIALVR